METTATTTHEKPKDVEGNCRAVGKNEKERTL